MIQPGMIVGFAWRFILVYVLLTLPWSPSRAAFGRAFRAVAGPLVKVAFPRQVTAVERHSDPARPSLDTRVTLGSAEGSSAGETSSRTLLLDSRSMGWLANAMWISLMLSTPLAWRHRLRSLLAGLVPVNVFVAVAVLVMVGRAVHGGGSAGSAGSVGLFFMVADHMLVENLWLSVLVPVLVWLAFVVRGLGQGLFQPDPPAVPSAADSPRRAVGRGS